MTRVIPNVLSIAGSDPGGGAGVQADLRTFAAFGVYGTAVPTALTAQSTRGVADVFLVPPEVVRGQLEVLLADVAFDAVKIGMLGDAATVDVVVGVLARYCTPNVVLDPVVRATSGAALLSDDGVWALRERLLPLVTVVTPNTAEVGALLAQSEPTTVAEAEAAAAALHALGARAAVVTGGHLGAAVAGCADVCIDTLADAEGVRRFAAPRRGGTGTHGTGCTYASALAAGLALGRTLDEACRAAQAFVGESVAASGRLRVGGGRGPVWQLHAAAGGASS